MTKSGTTPNQGDIVLIPVPFSDLSTVKRRPALVMSSTAYNRRSADIVVVGITSNPASQGAVPISNDSLVSGSLPVKSYVRPAHIYALDKGIITKHLGRVDQNTLQAVFSRLDMIFDRNPGRKS